MAIFCVPCAAKLAHTSPFSPPSPGDTNLFSADSKDSLRQGMTNCENFQHAACQTSKLDGSLFKPTKSEEHFGLVKCILFLLKRICMCSHTPHLCPTCAHSICLKQNPLNFSTLHSHPIHRHPHPFYMTL